MIVIDASITAAWLLAERGFSATPDLLDLLTTQEFVAPPHWSTEVGNAIRKAVRARRILKEDVRALVAVLMSLNVSIAPVVPVGEVESLVHLALQQGLSVYDAAYVRLAATTRVPLATLDDAMKAAAHRIGVTVVPA